MNQQSERHAPERGPDEQEQHLPSPRDWRTWLVDVVGGGITVATMFLIDKLRPGRHDRYHVEQHGERYTIEGLHLSEKDAQSNDDENAPRAPVAEAHGGGYYETAAGRYDAPPGIHEAPHSQWPIVVAAAIAFVFFGLVTSYAFSMFGVVVFIVGVVGWAAELLNE